MKSTASKRLARDLRELNACPVGRINAEPVNDNIFLWHGNVQGIDKSWSECVLHFSLEFSERYPSEPPKVILATAFPHPNVVPSGGRLEVCMDMLTTIGSTASKDAGRPYERWTSAFSVRSVLQQLVSFLAADYVRSDSLTPDRKALASACRNEAAKHDCNVCSHRATAGYFWPKVVTEDEAAMAPSNCNPVIAMSAASESFFCLQARSFEARIQSRQIEAQDKSEVQALASRDAIVEVLEVQSTLEPQPFLSCHNLLNTPETEEEVEEVNNQTENEWVSANRRGQKPKDLWATAAKSSNNTPPSTKAMPPSLPQGLTPACSLFSTLASLHGDPRPLCSACGREKPREKYPLSHPPLPPFSLFTLLFVLFGFTFFKHPY